MIVCENVSKYYGERAAVSGVSFTIQDGEVVGLLGLNGAGKTTTLRMLSGVLVPTNGRLLVDGVDLAQAPDAVRAKIGFLPEPPPLYPDMRVCDFLEFVAHIKGLKGDVRAAVDEALGACDLVGAREQFIGTLSHGYQRRVGIAQAIVHKPALILLDEPTSGLDPVQVVQMRKLIRNLGKKHTVLVSSHILSEIQQMCDRVLLLQQGKLVADGAPQALSQQAETATTVTIEVRGPREALAQALAKAAQVARHTIEREEQGVTHATVELTSDAREELARALVEAGLGLRRLERVRLELESVFLKLAAGDHASAKSGVPS